MSAPITSMAITFTPVPPPQPMRVNTVDVASTATTLSDVSQPTQSNHEIAEGSRFPLMPYAARLSTIVGAEPFFPAVAITPQSQKLKRTPTSPITIACQKEIPNPSTHEP